MDRDRQRTYEFGPFRLDVSEQRLLHDGEPIPLTPKMFELLRVLVENAGHLVEKEQLLAQVWSNTFVEEGNLNRGISVLRKALGETSAQRYIETVPKRGYRFVADVRSPGNDGSGTTGAPPIPLVSEQPNAEKTSIPRRRPIRRLGIAAGAVLTIGAIVYALLLRSEPTDPVISAGASIHRQFTFTGKELTPTLSPDGRRVAYVSNDPPRRKVMVQELSGGQPVEVFSAPETGWLRWSPDSSELMFGARGAGTDGLYLATLPGGGARRIAGGGPFVACWSPDGSTIALALFVARKVLFLNKVGEVGRTIALQGSKAWMWDMDWSPVSGRLLFVADDEQNRPTIWTIRPDGTQQTKVLSSPTPILAARWAPSGEALYYFGRVNQTVSLYKVFADADGEATARAPVALLSGLETDEGFGISADGKRLTYARAPYFSNLWVVEIGDSERGRQIRRTQLTHGTSVIERPRVSPDGKSILFSMGYESRANLYTMPATGGTPKQLTFLNAFSIGGVWSPDGRSVAFASDEGGKQRVWIVNADGSLPHPLPTSEMSDSFDLAWSPGTRVLYQQTGNRNYYLIDPRTPEQRLLIKDSSVGWLGSPAYSPDGKKIAVSWNRRPIRGVWLVDSEDSSETLIHGASKPSDSYPFPIGWSPDGTSIYGFEGKRAAYRGISVPFEETITEARIVRVFADSRQPEPVLSLPFDEIGSVAMFPDGKRFLCTVYSSRSDIWIVENFDAQAESRRYQP
jgi:Tol biopolymer transport system component/DNA-binding winged helix-turn-helix (wHTH) protein